MKENRNTVGFCTDCKKEVYELIRVNNDFLCYDCVCKLSQHLAELRKENEELKRQNANMWQVQKKQIDELIETKKWRAEETRKVVELQQELAEVRANGIFPKFKVGQEKWFNTQFKENRIRSGIITCISIKKKDSVKIEYCIESQKFATVFCNESELFDTKSALDERIVDHIENPFTDEEVEQALAEMREGK